MEIKVLGSGCRKCKSLLKAALEAVSEKKLDAQVEYVTELKRLTEYGVLFTPALMIDGVVVSAGRTLKKREILPLLEGKA